MKQLNNRSKQRGFTLLEIGIVLLVAAAIYLAVFGKSYFSKSQAGSQNEEGTISQMIEALPGTKGTYGTPATYGTAGNNLVPALINAKAVPSTYSTTATTVTNSWGGAITAVSTGSGFTITDNNLPNDICQSVVNGITTSGGNNGTLTATVNGAAYTNASTQCSTGANAVAFTSTN